MTFVNDALYVYNKKKNIRSLQKCNTIYIHYILLLYKTMLRDYVPRTIRHIIYKYNHLSMFDVYIVLVGVGEDERGKCV